jgi:peptidoglycan/xylan/chitin deacetylase (PgdA/CDA1 family)
MRYVKLTFDDGPDPKTTPTLLDTLMTHQVRATFFVIGRNVMNLPGRSILERMAADGHQIGNHSYSHPNLTKLDAKQISEEIARTNQAIGSLDGGIKLFRPPFGFRNEFVDNVVKELGYRVVLWNVTSLDWQPDYWNRRWVTHTMRQIRTKSDCIVLAHDVFSTTVAYIPALLAAIRKLPDTEFALVN